VFELAYSRFLSSQLLIERVNSGIEQPHDKSKTLVGLIVPAICSADFPWQLNARQVVAIWSSSASLSRHRSALLCSETITYPIAGFTAAKVRSTSSVAKQLHSARIYSGCLLDQMRTN
jgi:hypothetical protein